jgi:hypothetical protein
MIHILEVSPAMTPAALRKLARKYAMTGGVEIVLQQNLGLADMERLFEIHAPEVERYPRGTALRRSNNGARILMLVREESAASPELRSRIEALLAD